MSDFNINFGKGKDASSVNESNFKGGIKKGDIKDKKMLSIFKVFDDGNNILDDKEAESIKNKIIQFAAEDDDKKSLSKKEAKHLIKALNMDIKAGDLFKFLGILKQSSLNIKSCVTDEATKEVVVSYNDEAETSEKYDSNGKLISSSKKASYNNINGVLTKFSDGSLEFDYSKNSEVKLGSASFNISQNIKLHFPSQEAFEKQQPSKAVFNTNGGIEQVEEYTYQSNGKLASKKQIIDGKLSAEFKYDNNGNVLEQLRYDNEGNVTSRTEKTWNGDKQTGEKVYDANNRLRSETEFDENGRIKEKTEYNYNEYGETEYSKVVTKYTDGVETEENYLRADGTLFRKNEYSNGKLAKQTEYYPDGVHKKLEITYNGEEISTVEYNPDGSISKKTSNMPDGYFGPSSQIGQGDCYLLASINAITRTANGQQILSNLIKKNGSSYTVTLPGAVTAARQMKNDSRFKKGMFITGTYTFTATQLQDIMRQAGSRYSSGDPDVMLIEAAFERYREEVLKTQRKNNIQGPLYGYAGGSTGEDPNNLLCGGFEHDAIFILTGRRSEVYMNYDQGFAMSDSELTDYDQFYSAKSTLMSMPHEIINETSSKQRLNKMLDKVMNDSNDGHIDFVVTCSFLTDGGNSAHALTVKSVTADKVILINPWSPSETITMSRKDFINKVLSVTVAEIPYQDMSNTPSPTPTPAPTPAPDNQEIVKTVKIKARQGYNAFIKTQLQEQGVTNPTSEQITKAKRQFEAANPKTDGSQAYVHTWNQSSKPEWIGNKYLIAGETYKVPKFDV